MAANQPGTQKGFSQVDQPGQPTSQEGLTSEARQGKANHWPIQPSLASKARPAGQPIKPARPATQAPPASQASRASQPGQPWRVGWHRVAWLAAILDFHVNVTCNA